MTFLRTETITNQWSERQENVVDSALDPNVGQELHIIDDVSAFVQSHA